MHLQEALPYQQMAGGLDDENQKATWQSPISVTNRFSLDSFR
jgi:hypothetical protein